ncbi:HPr kinase/phosphorylase [Sneathiella chinensis]|uniref:HPr kinase n=1 Tax=Sneathiella chinensis TaxID=349750 RepID=A0ABQ5TZK4_9PROT|nr:hypothetical protein [Sneathiella chinensis]GLQ04876.1 HPr kinase [Sneathiella chinensis]
MLIDRTVQDRQGIGMIILHATAVAIEGRAILLRGPSGAGKSDIALQLLDGGATLIADDYVELHGKDGQVLARPPAKIAGLMEIRGIGLVQVPHVSDIPVAFAVNLADKSMIERLPEQRARLHIDDIPVPLVEMDGQAPSTPARIRFLLTQDWQSMDGSDDS